MNLAKSMEAIVIAAFAMTFLTAVATASAPTRSTAPAAVTSETMTTIVVTGKRLTAAQKAGLVG